MACGRLMRVVPPTRAAFWATKPIVPEELPFFCSWDVLRMSKFLRATSTPALCLLPLEEFRELRVAASVKFKLEAVSAQLSACDAITSSTSRGSSISRPLIRLNSPPSSAAARPFRASARVKAHASCGRIRAHAVRPQRAVTGDAFTDLCRVSAAAVETLLPNGLQWIPCPEIQGENVRRHTAWVFAYQFAFVYLIGRYFQ